MRLFLEHINVMREGRCLEGKWEEARFIGRASKLRKAGGSKGRFGSMSRLVTKKEGVCVWEGGGSL